MTVGRIFAVAVAVLETCAALGYAYERNWRLTILWTGYAIAAWALAGVKG